MTVIGRNTIAGNNLSRANQGSDNQFGFFVTIPNDGQITMLHCYCAAVGSSCQGALVVWRSSGVFVGATAKFALPIGTTAVNGQAWNDVAPVAPIAVTAGNYLIGFWRDPTGQVAWSYQSGVGLIVPDVTSLQPNVALGSNIVQNVHTSGSMSCYVDYTPATNSIEIGPTGSGSGLVVSDIRIGPPGNGAPLTVNEVWIGPPGSGAPVKIWG